MVGGAGEGPAEGTEPEEVSAVSNRQLQSEVEALRSEVDSLRMELEKQTSNMAHYLDAAKRIQADFDNYKKRVQRDRDEYAKQANDKLISELLDFLDDLERALCSPGDVDDLKKGICQIQSNLLALLRSYGLREMPAEGDFDPNLHEALCTAEGEDGKICEVFQKGYLLGPRVIRHAKVKVGKKSEKGEQNG
jgi:molecular chaperone GrpE